MRSANAIFEVPEARPAWKTIRSSRGYGDHRIGFPVSALAIVFTGRFADWVGRAVGVAKTSAQGFRCREVAHPHRRGRS